MITDTETFDYDEEISSSFEFLYNPGLAGTRKTWAIIEVTDGLTRKGIGSIHTVGSKALAKEVESKHKEPCRVINSDTVDSVGKTIKEIFRNEELKKINYILTHHSILYTMNLPYSGIILFWDELFDPTIHIELNSDEYKNFSLKELFNEIFIIPSLDKPYSNYSPILLNEKSKNKLWDKINELRPKFDEDEPIRNKLLNLLISVARSKNSKCEVWSHNQFNNNFLNGDGKKFVATIFTKPEIFNIFKQVRFSAAGFEYSLLFHLWHKLFGVNWKIDKMMNKKLKEPKLKEIEVYYLADKNGATRTFFNKNNPETDETILQTFYKESHKKLIELGIDKVLMLKNNDDPFMYESIECEIAPFNNEGRNDFAHHHTVIYTGAFNKPNPFYDIMGYFGLSEEAKRDAVERAYQTLYRTCIRIDGDNTIVRLFIPSKHLFPKHLHQRFSKVNFIKIGDLKEEDPNKGGQPKGSIKVDPTLKTRRQYIINLKAKVRKKLKEQKINPKGINDGSEIVVSFFDKPIVDKDGDITAFPSDGDEHNYSRSEFYEFLKEKSEMKNTKKTENFSFSLVKFKNQKRLKDNAEWIYGVVLDFDTTKEAGLITYEKIKELLGPVECFIHSTYSGGFKRRVIILFKEPVEPEEAGIILLMIYSTFITEYPDCELDHSSTNFAQPYFLPCLPKNKDDYFAEYYSGEAFDTMDYLVFGISLFDSKQQAKQKNELLKTFKLKSDSIEYQEQNYLKFVYPVISQMKPKNRFYLGQQSVGYCKNYCPKMKDKLFADFKKVGVSKTMIKDFENLWNSKSGTKKRH